MTEVMPSAGESARAVTVTSRGRGQRRDIGGKVGLAPHQYLKKLVDVLDKVDLVADLDPRRDNALTVAPGELDRVALDAASVDDIRLDVT